MARKLLILASREPIPDRLLGERVGKVELGLVDRIGKLETSLVERIARLEVATEGFIKPQSTPQ